MLSFHTFFPKSTRYGKFINVVSDSTLQLMFKKAPMKFGYTIKVKYPWLYDKEIIKKIYKYINFSLF